MGSHRDNWELELMHQRERAEKCQLTLGVDLITA